MFQNFSFEMPGFLSKSNFSNALGFWSEVLGLLLEILGISKV